ncbi:hypothetical protein L1987_13433 [Smallanthus sonchifolius]|uniref:Uncharacterized protein n=1 Tax=Smallanthus sonchifolius TaxID=185202 RepID=A0ACB9JGV9_9ASTR|nr:hypothetical protein L1987_13433 [Smallanthus sonchifolius]
MLFRRKKTETKDDKLLELEWYIIGEEDEKETKYDEHHGENEDKEDDDTIKELEWHKDGGDEFNEDDDDEEFVNEERKSEDRLYEHEEDEEDEVDEHDEDDVDLGVDDEEESEHEINEDGSSEDGSSEEQKDEDVQREKVKKKRKLNLNRNASTQHKEVLKTIRNANTQHFGQDNQKSLTTERMMSKLITGDDVGDDVTTKAPIFDQTPHTSKYYEDQSSQSDFTASMMIEYEIKEKKNVHGE